MVRKGNRSFGHPVIVENGIVEKLRRLSLSGGEFDEQWLQKLIHDNPSMLPVDEVDSSFSPLLSIGKEIRTAVGFLDNLFVSPEGYITIVETKLWRNPEARREVVGQIIDYAKELSKWTFSDLDKAIAAYNSLNNGSKDGLLATVGKQFELDESEEQYFIDSISKNLKRGRFLLLIVGDGIRESVEDMVEYLSQSPQLQFTLALIELQVFRITTNNSLIVIPQVVTRTQEITRAIVRLEGATADLQVRIETDLGMETSRGVPQGKRVSMSAEDFFEHLASNTNKEIVEFTKQLIKDCEEKGYFIVWNSSSFSVKLLDPQGSGLKISLFTIDHSGFLYLGYSKGQLQKLEIPALLPGIEPHPVSPHVWKRYSTIKDLQPVYSHFLHRVDEYVQQLRVLQESLSE